MRKFLTNHFLFLNKLFISLLFIGIAGLAYSQNQSKVTVTGIVADQQGQPLSGVSIQEKGNLSNGAATDEQGKYTIDVPANATLVFTYLGFLTKEESIGSKSIVNVFLDEDAQLLGEAIVVGYGTTKQGNLTGAVTQIKGDILESRPISNISQGLQGVIPNLNVSLNSGAPGQSTSFNVRGTTSINSGAGPLVLVDNVQMDPDLINPNDIASITVLKDAASAAIYGARAAFGVILIETKGGRRAQKPQINVSVTGYWQNPAKKIETVNSMEYLTIMDLAHQNGGGSGHKFDPKIYEYAERYFNDPANNSPVFFDKDIDPIKYQYVGNTNWWDEIYKKNSFSQQYNVGITGGTENTVYYISTGLNKVGGALKYADDFYQKWNTNINVSTNITKWLKVTGKTRYNYTKEEHPSGGTSAMNSTAYAGITPYSGYLKNDLRPLMPVRHPNGNFAGQGSFTNPAAIQAQGGNALYKKNDIWLTGAVQLTPLEGLIINADYTYNVYMRGDKTHVRQFYDYTAVPGTENFYPWTNPSSVAMANNEDYYNAFNLFAEYRISLKQDHNFKIMAGYNQEYKHTKYFWTGNTYLIDNDNPTLQLTSGTPKQGSSESQWGIEGVFARFNYDYKGIYLLEFNGRFDSSSKFPKGDRSKFFPSVSAGYRISEESFWTPMKEWWNNMKIRASYGSLGNQYVGTDFPYLSIYGTGRVNYILGGEQPLYVTPGGLVSPSFTWETVNQVDIGVDMEFLNNRLSASFDWYRRDTKDMFTATQQQPGILGTNPPNKNAADLKTTGFELVLTWRDHLNFGMDYWVRATLSDYQAEITKYDNTAGLINTHYVGKKMGDIWGFRSDGLFQSDQEAQDYLPQTSVWSGTWGAGDVRYVNLNGDTEISKGKETLSDHGDLAIIGNNTPRYNFGLTLGMEYKGFDFEMFWQGTLKRDYMPGGVHFWGLTSEWDVPLKEALDYWTENNKGAYFPRPHWDQGGNRQTSDRYMQNAAYARLKTLSIGYSLPKNILEKVGISKLRVYVVGENLLTITSLIKSFDPETLSNMTYPIMRKYSIGLNLTF